MSRLYMNYPSGDAVVELIPEASRLNINEAAPEDLVRVIATVSGDPALAQQIAAAIIDWRSGAGRDSGGPAGSPFDAYYLGLNSSGGPTFRARHASFEEIEELLFVRGMTPELFYGNYISDALAAQVGGIGIAPGANTSDSVAMFEATHGTAPKYAGKDYVNPGSLILSAEMMLRHMGWVEAADLIITSMEKTILDKVVTYDFARLMEGAKQVSCSGFGDAMIERMKQ